MRKKLQGQSIKKLEVKTHTTYQQSLTMHKNTWYNIDKIALHQKNQVKKPFALFSEFEDKDHWILSVEAGGKNLMNLPINAQ